MAAGCQQTNLVGRSARNLLACLAWQWRVGTPVCSSIAAHRNNAAPLVPLRLPHNRPRRRRRTWYLRLCMSNCPSFCVAVLQAKATRQEEDLALACIALQLHDPFPCYSVGQGDAAGGGLGGAAGPRLLQGGLALVHYYSRLVFVLLQPQPGRIRCCTT